MKPAERQAHLKEVLGTQWPLIQAPMAGIQTAALAVAVSNTGALGSLPCAMLTLGALRAELTALTAGTFRPYNVNFFAHTNPQPDEAREAAWRATLAPYYAEFGIDPSQVPAGPGRAPFSQAAADVLADFKPPVVSFHFGLPDEALLQQVRAWGAKVLASATTVQEAVWLAERGVDAIIAQGLEAGGHRGMFLHDDLQSQQGLFGLLPQIVARVQVPVIAAGGIVDAQGVAAALALGASGVQVGTAYMLCPECTTSAVHRAALGRAAVAGAADLTALTNLFTGRPARGIINRLMREAGPLSTAAPAFPLATAALAPLRAAAEKMGRDEFSPLWSGQNATGCKAMGAAELTRELLAGFTSA